MDGLVRSGTTSMSRRFDIYSYEPLDRVKTSANRHGVGGRRSMFESPDKSQRSRCMKLNKVACKVKTAAVKLVSSFYRIGAYPSCNCREAIRASSPTPRRN
ncbi:hypothetical protein ACFX13_046249 [Malus domestica]